MAQGNQYFLKPADGERVELTGDTSVGRSGDCDLVVSEGAPSRQHAKITVEGGGVFVEDLGSTNGTFVNGARISSKQQLNQGDEVAFDVNKFQFEVEGAEPAPMDQTVLRQPEDPNRTVLRPMPPKEAVSEPEPTAADPAPEPAPPAAAQAPSKPSKGPGAWADPNAKNASATQFFSAEDLAAMRSGESAQAKVESDQPILQVTSGNAAGSVIQLVPDGDKKEWTIGSADGRDIVFKDQGVSEFHTILAHESGRWKVVDQMSTNGTFVNGNKTVTGFLNSGDKIRIGTVECSFELPGGAAKAPSAAGAASGGANKVVVSAIVFVVVLAVLFGAYFLL